MAAAFHGGLSGRLILNIARGGSVKPRAGRPQPVFRAASAPLLCNNAARVLRAPRPTPLQWDSLSHPGSTSHWSARPALVSSPGARRQSSLSAAAAGEKQGTAGTPPPPSGPTSDEVEFWAVRWKDGRTAFHLPNVNEHHLPFSARVLSGGKHVRWGGGGPNLRWI